MQQLLLNLGAPGQHQRLCLTPLAMDIHMQATVHHILTLDMTIRRIITPTTTLRAKSMARSRLLVQVRRSGVSPC